MNSNLQKLLSELKNNIIEIAKKNEELRHCVDAQQATIAAANQLIAKLKEDNSQLLDQMNNRIQLKPDWKDAPEWATWLAQDCDGEWYWFDIEPHIAHGMWLNGSEVKAATILGWEDTLEPRPMEGEQ